MIVERFRKNPILTPNKNHSWESEAVFNGCPVKKGKDIFLLYRAVSLPHYHTTAQTKLMVSDIGIAQSEDGINFSNHRRFIIPEYQWERFGCEDPRVTKMNGKYFIFYTALSAYPFRAEGIRIGVAISKDLERVEEKHLVTPFNAKAMALFPEKIAGKLWTIFTAHTDQPPAKICLASFDKEKDLWSEKYWERWHQQFEKYALPLERKPQDQTEVGAPPIKTKYGWLVIYSYIRNYFSSQRLFGIEAVLLDLRNPANIIARTNAPMMVAEEYYERIGIVPNVVFPSGVLLKGDSLYLYYGAADTTCCLAFVSFPDFLEKLVRADRNSIKLLRSMENPILTSRKENAWERKAVFNPAAIFLEGRVHLVYRAMSDDNTSVFGYAASRDGVHIDERLQNPIYTPRESFEQKKQPGGNSGCEDPRLTKIGDKIYMCYTAFDGKNPPRVALTSIRVQDFLAKKWTWSKPVPISPPDLDDKDACIFPEKIKGKYFIIHRSGDDIDLSVNANLDFDGSEWLEEYRWIAPRKGMWDGRKVGIAAPPIKTNDGWILFYHGVSEEDGVYRVGAVLLDRTDPMKIIARTDEPLFEPETPYEKGGQVSNVVFPCGAVVLGETIFVYYGGADRVTGVATIKMKDLKNIFKLYKC